MNVLSVDVPSSATNTKMFAVVHLGSYESVYLIEVETSSSARTFPYKPTVKTLQTDSYSDSWYISAYLDLTK